MSFEVTAAFVQEFSDTIHQLAQQREAKLRPYVRLKTGVVGKNTHFDRIGPTEAYQRTIRHNDVIYVNTPTPGAG